MLKINPKTKMDLDYHYLMGEALQEARQGFELGEVPVGAVLVDSDGTIIAKDHNQPISLSDPTAHAEILVLRRAGREYHNYRMNGATLIVTVEPCMMCMGAALHARIDRLVFGAYDAKWGAASSLYQMGSDRRLNHRFEVIPGVRFKECQTLMQQFFQMRRNNGSVKKWRDA